MKSCLLIAGEKSGEEHALSFFSQLKKETRLPIPVNEHKLRRFVDIPKVFPKYIKVNITIPIKKPEIDQCQV